MHVVTRKIYCAFPQEIIQEPLLYSIATQFSVVPNIRGASVREDEATMDLELEGDEQAIESVIEYLRKRGITVNE
ncbi:MAG: FeS-binding protein [Planctomycetota bacterium]|nr:MAG: FeS-binding protein [Planctomycetota bacterium]